MKYAWALMAVLLMSGCASMTREQCQSVDPQAQGYADGQKGLTTRSVDQLLSACQSGKRAGSISDVSRFKNDYLKAYQKGLVEYCTPANGERVGLLGQEYLGVCPKEVEAPFLKEYLYALKQYRDANPQPVYYHDRYYYNPFFWPHDPFWYGPYPRSHFRGYMGW